MSYTKVPEKFLHNCFEKMLFVWEMLVAFKQGHSTEENGVSNQQLVMELTRCLCLLKMYTAEMDKCYCDERGFSPHRRYV